MRILLLTTLFFIFFTHLHAQQLTFAYVDSLTYAQFTQKEYKALQATGKKALAQDIDFHYLRMRMGISYYNQQNYQKAIPHFRKALSNYPQDTLIQEYLYYSILLTGRTADAYELAATFPEALQTKIKHKKGIVTGAVSLEGGAGLTNNTTLNGDKSMVNPPRLGMMDSTYRGEAIYNGNLYYGKAMLEFSLKRRFHLYAAFSFFNTNSNSKVQARLPPPPFPPTVQSVVAQISNYQYQYNTAIAYTFPKDWTIGLGAGYYKEDFGFMKTDSISPSQQKIVTHTERSNKNYFAASALLAKRFGNVQPSISLTVNNIRGSLQPQVEAAMLYYPKGNANFYGVTSFAVLKGTGQPQLVFNQKLGFKLAPTVYLELNAAYGNLQNYIAAAGFLTYNTLDPIKLILGADLKIRIKNFELAPVYRLQQRTGTMTLYTTPQTSHIQNFNYFSHFLTLSLTCNF